MKDITHKAGLFACLAVTSMVGRRLLEKSWEAGTSRPVPKDPETSGVSWKEALLWGATAGVVAGLLRTSVRRGYAELTDRSVE